MARKRSRWGRVTIAVAAGIGLLWFVIHAVADLIGPAPEEIATGRMLFEHEWTVGDPLAGDGDGLGPVFNAKSCVACHFQGGVGGAGPNRNNVLAFDVLPTRRDPKMYGGVVHAFATRPEFEESIRYVSRIFPIVPGGVRIIADCRVNVADFNPVRFSTVNTPALFGAGLINDISATAIRSRKVARLVSTIKDEFELNFKTTPAGRTRILPDGRVGRFGWKGQFATLEDFVAAACAVEVGLTNPHRSQDVPRKHREDESAKPDLNDEQFRSLVAFVDTLPKPKRVLPEDSEAIEQARRGNKLFISIGCSDCHTRRLGGVDGIYSDLLLHRIGNPADSKSYGRRETEVEPPGRFPLADEWKTPPLWGVADSAPYFHDGGSPTLHDAILRHNGEAKHVKSRYMKAQAADREAIIAFLKTMRAPN